MKKKVRGAGILLPISSLPSPYGIGTFGREAFCFIDQLVQAKQKYWQVLPIGPTSYGDSPYQSFSAFAGNPYFIDLDYLVEEGLLKESEIEQLSDNGAEDKVDYAAIYKSRFVILKHAFQRSRHQEDVDYLAFCEKTQFWLSDYALYMAVKNHFQDASWLSWDADIRNRETKAVMKYEALLQEEIGFWKFCQYKFFEQWNRVKSYANQKGIQIIGDIPLYVAMDSADVWVHGRLFDLDERKNPIHIAGVPPDNFSATGQRWGNPLYRWDVMEREDFLWWRARMAASAALYDVIRIDHFIGIVRYFGIPNSCETAEHGEYQYGPGEKLTRAIKESIGESEIIAEDLGVVVPKVRRLINKTGWPGMKVLEFAFDSGAGNENLPHNYKTNNCIVDGGTHDNETMEGFFGRQKARDLRFVKEYLHVKRKKEIREAVIRLGYQSIANTVIFQMQDIIGLDNKARMNFPGTLGGNWEWRLKKGQFGETEQSYLAQLTTIYGR
ncbi:MAG: 4-alpha-glucanotransferase [Clostridiales bacterium]|nr:4-alpha-glucanotransferase [Clostridiales bacterium]